MKKVVLAGIALVAIVFSPLAESRAEGHRSSPSIYFEVSLGMPSYDKVWVPGHREKRHGHWIWFEGYWEKRYKPTAAWVSGHWKKRHGHRVWVAGHWGKSYKQKDYRHSKKKKKRKRHWKEHSYNLSH